MSYEESIMLNVKLDPETEAYLIEIANQEKTTPEVLLKSLIHQRWISLHPPKTIVERLGGHPEHLLEDAPANLSEREHRKRAIADYLMKRHPQQFLQEPTSPEERQVRMGVKS